MAEKVSIVMPAHNAGAYIREAVTSALSQSFADFEMIVVNDGSTDSTGAILDALARRDARLRVAHLPNGGAGAARNAALGLASGAIVALIDADDRWHPQLLQTMLAALEDAPGIDIVFPRHRWIRADGTAHGRETPPGAADYRGTDLMLDNPIDSTSGVVLRRSAIDRAGGYDPKMPACVDIDFFARAVAGRGAAIRKVDAVLADYRRHDGQVTADWRRLRDGWERMVAKAVEAGHGPAPDEIRRGRARAGLLWADIAYQARDYRVARRLMGACLRGDPALVLGDPYGRVRLAAAIASLLPEPAHRALRERVNASSP